VSGRLIALIEKRLDPEAQLAWSETALAKHQGRWGNESRPAVNLMEAVAHRLDRAGRLDEALIVHMSAFNKRTKAQGSDNPATLHSEMCVGKMLSKVKR
jgi:hypothetical protein